MPTFTDENIENLFGAEDAENEEEERFKQYFFSNKAYENLQSSLPIRLLVGHKGVGKSALLKRSFLSAQDDNAPALWITPSHFSQHFSQVSGNDFNQLVHIWKHSLIDAIFSEVISNWTEHNLENEGWKKTFGNIGGVFRNIINSNSHSFIDATRRHVAEEVAKSNRVDIYIDDLDRGWDASKNSIRNISSLLTAIRDISGINRNIKFRIALRSDVYFLVRTSDESTDKIERQLVWLEWSNHEILAIMAKRIATYFNDDIDQSRILKLNQTDILNRFLTKVIEPRFSGRGHWSNAPIHRVLLSLTRRRPRDLVKMMHGSAKEAYSSGRGIISSIDLEKTFASYSEERLQDIINEFKSELPQIEMLLLNMKPTTKERRTALAYQFTTDQLVNKLKNIMSNVPMNFTTGKPISPRTLIAFLYKIDFITARKVAEEKITREYFDQRRFLASEFADFGFDWEVHPAYRWALQPQNLGSVIDSIQLD